MNGCFIKKEIKMVNNHVKRCLTSLAMKEMGIWTTRRYHHTPIIIAKMQNTASMKCSKIQSNGNSYNPSENAKWCSHSAIILAVSYTIKCTYTIWLSNPTPRYTLERNNIYIYIKPVCECFNNSIDCS